MRFMKGELLTAKLPGSPLPFRVVVVDIDDNGNLTLEKLVTGDRMIYTPQQIKVIPDKELVSKHHPVGGKFAKLGDILARKRIGSAEPNPNMPKTVRRYAQTDFPEGTTKERRSNTSEPTEGK